MLKLIQELTYGWKMIYMMLLSKRSYTWNRTDEDDVTSACCNPLELTSSVVMSVSGGSSVDWKFP